MEKGGVGNWGMPFTAMVLMTCLEEVSKVGVSTVRVRKYKWAKQLV